MSDDFNKTYDPSKFEDRIYKLWEEKGCFVADAGSGKRPYSVVMPPPNITGQLHMGHALDDSLQDILIRFKRMQGYETLWLPGVDHAAIATEVRLTKELEKEGKSKEKVGKEKFLARAWEWKKVYEAKIISQIKKLGASCDWTRKRFTMDEGCCASVSEFFIRLFNEGLIYRGERTVNWCVNCKTSLSDAEIDFRPENGFLYYVKYFFKDSKKFIVVATTRPETIFGDVAVAVNPSDDRFSGFSKCEVVVPLVERTIQILFDRYVDYKFGTGALKITPAHDHNDFEIGLRHNLKTINIFDEEARLNANCGKYCGLDRFMARKAVVADLQKNGFIEKIEPYEHNVSCCYRCGSVIEPKISTQWFVKMKKLAKPAIDVVRKKEIEFVPSNFEKIYYNWLDNIKDWCISRQLWWGHSIPAYYCKKCGSLVVSKKTPKICENCGCENFKQDDDTLDTWFSSALWPYSTFGWPNEKAKDYEFFYPTSTLVTGYDIIFFWVARMIFSAIKNTGKIPFRKVFVHGLVRDEQGRKMSKSLNNGIDPLKVIEKYGADALRFAVANGVNAGNDLRYSEDKIISSRNFANKLWNVSRFVALNISGKFEVDYLNIPKDLQIEDKWVLCRLNGLIKEVSENIENFEISVASQKIYDFIWDILCDWYVEIAKLRFKNDVFSNEARQVLSFLLVNSLKLLHPFMPFITEEIFSNLPFTKGLIAVSSWPIFDENLNFSYDCKNFDMVIFAIKAVRNLKSEMKIPNKAEIDVFIETKFENIFKDGFLIFKSFVCAKDVVLVEKADEALALKCKVIVTSFARIFVLLNFSNLKNNEHEHKNLLKEKEFCEKEILIFEKKLSNENFLKKAPSNIVKKEREKLEAARRRLALACNSLKELDC